ncbi:hypothetical protein K449DRAFT_428789 [Hypoxylon sp. EC38]|nr:hypothetical protein K449DRAFT_428789 [Hypoxylon sp. EC38]
MSVTLNQNRWPFTGVLIIEAGEELSAEFRISMSAIFNDDDSEGTIAKNTWTSNENTSTDIAGSQRYDAAKTFVAITIGESQSLLDIDLAPTGVSIDLQRLVSSGVAPGSLVYPSLRPYYCCCYALF